MNEAPRSGHHRVIAELRSAAEGCARGASARDAGPRWPSRLGQIDAVLPVTLIGLIALFFVVPGTIAHKSHLLLHGLCAQRPSHSLVLGGNILPFDARMTGIYGGFAVAFAFLVWRRRLWAFQVPPLTVMFGLGMFVAMMGLDGANSLLVDLGLPHPYQPDNRLRLATGLLTGSALAVALCFLLAATLWRTGDWTGKTVHDSRELLMITALQVPFAVVALSGVGGFYPVMVILLVGSAVTVVASMVLVVVLLLRRSDRSFEHLAEARRMVLLAVVAALVVMAGLSWGRVWLERTLGMSSFI